MTVSSNPPTISSVGDLTRRNDAPAKASMPKMIAALKEAGGQPKFTEYPGVGHNSWDMAYGTKELFEWLLLQSRK